MFSLHDCKREQENNLSAALRKTVEATQLLEERTTSDMLEYSSKNENKTP
jgi:hypothetical protein